MIRYDGGVIVAPLLLALVAPELPEPLAKMYAQRDRLMMRKDVKGLQAMLRKITTPDFTMTMMGGTQNRKQMIANAAAGFSSIHKIVSLKSEVLSWDGRLGGGTAVMKSTVKALMKAEKGKKPAPLSYSYTTTDVWQFVQEGWQLRSVTEVK